MAPGIVHTRHTLIASGLLAVAAIIPDNPGGIAVALGCASGLWFSPDLDIWSDPTKRWGVLNLYWYPYRKLIKHRSPVSHTLLVSTLLRALYFLPLVLAPLMALGASWLDIWIAVTQPHHASILIQLLIGQAIADGLHLFDDGLIVKFPKKTEKTEKPKTLGQSPSDESRDTSSPDLITNPHFSGLTPDYSFQAPGETNPVQHVEASPKSQPETKTKKLKSSSPWDTLKSR